MADAFRSLVAEKISKPNNINGSIHKDKLLQTKLREKEIKEAHKTELQAKKQQKEEERRQEASVLRQERQFHDSKRAAADRREAIRREHHKESGQMCEHGVWRCKICFPHKATKPRD